MARSAHNVRSNFVRYINQTDLYGEFKLDEAWDSEHNKKLIRKMPALYALPDAKEHEGKTHIRVFTGKRMAFDPVQFSKIKEITDGPGNTILLVEAGDAVAWTKPEEIIYDEKLVIEKHLRFVNGKTAVAFCDGSGRMIPKGIDGKIWHWLLQKDDGNPIPDLQP